MGGKRPDQYRIDSNEGRTSDHKFMPDEPREADLQDRRYSVVMEGEIKAIQPIPADVLDPEAERRRRAAHAAPGRPPARRGRGRK